MSEADRLRAEVETLRFQLLIARECLHAEDLRQRGEAARCYGRMNVTSTTPGTAGV